MRGDIYVEQLPYDKDAEMAVLSAVLREPSLLDSGTVHLMVLEEFYFEHHRHVFEAIKRLHYGDVCVNRVNLDNLAVELRRAERLEQVGGRQYLAVLFAFPQPEDIDLQVLILQSHMLERRRILKQ